MFGFVGKVTNVQKFRFTKDGKKTARESMTSIEGL